MTSAAALRPRHRAAPRVPAGLWVLPVLLVGGALAGCSGTATGGATVTVTPTVVVTPTPTTASSTTPRLVPPQTYDEALAHLATGSPDPAAPTAFTSPSGNIVCTIVAGGAVRGCDLRAGRIAPPTPTFCSGGGETTGTGGAGRAKDIGRVAFTPAGPVAVCNTGTVSAPGAPVLAYGSRTQSGSVGCVSETIGVTCVDTTTRTGFFLARDTFFVV